MRSKKIASTFVLALIAVPMILAFQNCGQGFQSVELTSMVEEQADELARSGASQTFASTTLSYNLTVSGGGSSKFISDSYRGNNYSQQNFLNNLRGQFKDQCFILAYELRLRPGQSLACTVSGSASIGRQSTAIGGYAFGNVINTAIGVVWEVVESSVQFGPASSINYPNTNPMPVATPMPTPMPVATPAPTPAPTAPPVMAPTCAGGSTYYSQDFDLGCGGKGSCWSQGSFSGGVFGASRQYPTWYASCPIGVTNTNSMPVATPVPTPRPVATPAPTPVPTATPVVICGTIDPLTWGACSGRVVARGSGQVVSVSNTRAGYTGNIEMTCGTNGQWTPSAAMCAPITAPVATPAPTPVPVATPRPTPYPTPAPVTSVSACPDNATGVSVGTSQVCSCTTGAGGNSWGTGIYTDDSNICRAAFHSGVLYSAGRVRFTKLGAQSSFTGSTQNGITSYGYGYWGGSFSVSAP